MAEGELVSAEFFWKSPIYSLIKLKNPQIYHFVTHINHLAGWQIFNSIYFILS